MMLSDKKRRRTAGTAWIESIDPLAGLTIQQARAVYNAARRHGSPLLQKIFAEIEASDPVLMTCVERRAAALSGLGWRAVADASAADPERAEAQRKALEGFASGIENLDEAIEHLDLAFFRGHAVVQPIWEGAAVRRVALLESWNFLRGDDGRLLWNPECATDPAKCEEITPAARAVILLHRRAIDWPALSVRIRKHVGERDWGRFLERYGIPPVDVVMAPGTNKDQRDDYVESVEASHDGRSTAWPAGSQISRAEGARGQDPFSAYIEHQEKQIVLMATGGTLTSLAQADTGSLAGGAQMDVWEQIVSRDGVKIAGALNRALFLPFLRLAFPGEEPMAHFELGREKEADAKETAELAATLRGAGWRIDQSQLEEAVGYTLEREEAAPGGLPMSGNKAAVLPGIGKGRANDLPIIGNKAGDLPNLGKGRANAEGSESFSTHDSRDSQDSIGVANPVNPVHDVSPNALLRSFAADTSEAAKRLAALLEKADKGEDIAAEARKLAEELPGLMPEEPAMAEELASAMAEAFAEEIGATKDTGDTKEEKLANTGTSEGAKKGWLTRKKNGWTPKQVEENRKIVHELAAEALSDPNSHRTETLGTVNDQVAKDIEAVLPGVKTEGFEQTISSNDIRHARNEHGPYEKSGKKARGETRKNQLPLGQEDYDRIPEVLSDYDRIEAGTPEKRTGLPSVRYVKGYSDGMEVVVEVIATDEKTLRYKTGWKLKPAETAGSGSDVLAPPTTSKTAEPTKAETTTAPEKGKGKA